MDEKTTSDAEKMLAMSRQRDGKSTPVIDKKDVLSIAVDYMQNDIALESFNSEESEVEYHVSRSCEDVVQGLFGNLKRFRIYGSVTRFVEELMIFQNFPGSHKNFSMSATSKYYTVPVIYYSRGRREKFVCKQDLFSILHHLMLKTIPLSQIPLIRSMTTVFLKKEEDKLGGRMQFVKYSAEEMKSIEMDLSETQLTFIDDEQKLKSTFFKEEILEKLRSDFSNCSLVEILAKFTKLVPMNWGVKESANIRKGLESVECFHDPHEWLRFVVCSYTNTICIIKKFEAIIKKRPHMFKDSSRFNTQLGLESESSPEDSPSSSPSRPTVRLFEDGPLRYVMRDEMLMAIGYTCSCRKDTIKSDFCCEADKKTVLGMPIEEVMRKYRDRVDEIDFIRIPILRTRHRAVPISASSILCQFYVPAVDGLLEILKSLIWGSRIFQAFPVKRKKDLYELFAVLGSLLQCQNDFPFFIQRSELLQITLLCAQKCSFHSKSELTEVRDVPENGFTLQALKSEIKYLELPGFLPDILNHAKRVYQEIDRNKKDEVLRTCDMFEAIESCQLISIFNLFPKLKSFLHAQKCCRRIPGLHCDTCKEFTSSSEFTQKEGPPTEKFVELADLCMDAKDMVQKLIAHGQYCSSEDDDDDDDEEDGDSDDVGDEDEEENDSDIQCSNSACSECRSKFKNTASQTDYCCGDRELRQTTTEVENARIRIEAFEKTLDRISEENLKMVERVKKDLKKKHDEVEALKRKMKMFDAIQKKCSGHEKKVMELEEMLKKKEKEVEECKRDLANINTTTRSKIENLEKELKKTQKQSETLKSKLTTKCSQNSTILDENEKLRIRLAETESREILNKEHYQISKAKFDEDRAKFSERIAEIGRELRSEKTRIQTLESQLREAETIRINTAENIQHREKDMANQMQHHMQIIHESNVNLRAESEMQKRTIHELMRRLEISEQEKQRNLQQMEATNYQNYQPPSPSSHQLQYHHQQNAYRTPQEDPLLPSPKSTKLLLPIGAERAANRTPKQDSAPFSTTSPFPLFYPNSGGIQKNLENSHLNPSILQNLNLNLETSSSSNPEIQMTSSMDTECVICLTEMQYGDYTIKCHECRRRLHSQCASDWLKVRSICPTCQGQLLDPNEFSTL